MGVAMGGAMTSACLTTLYCLSLVRQLSFGLWVANSLFCCGLVVASAVGPFAALGPWFLAHNYIVQCKLHKDEDKEQMTLMHDWVMAQNPPEDRTSHWWSEELPTGPKEAFEAIATCTEIDEAFRR